MGAVQYDSLPLPPVLGVQVSWLLTVMVMVSVQLPLGVGVVDGVNVFATLADAVWLAVQLTVHHSVELRLHVRLGAAVTNGIIDGWQNGV